MNLAGQITNDLHRANSDNVLVVKSHEKWKLYTRRPENRDDGHRRSENRDGDRDEYKQLKVLTAFVFIDYDQNLIAVVDEDVTILRLPPPAIGPRGLPGPRGAPGVQGQTGPTGPTGPSGSGGSGSGIAAYGSMFLNPNVNFPPPLDTFYGFNNLGPLHNVATIPYPFPVVLPGGYLGFQILIDGEYEVAFDARVDNLSPYPQTFECGLLTGTITTTHYLFAETVQPGDTYTYSERILIPLHAGDNVGLTVSGNPNIIPEITVTKDSFTIDPNGEFENLYPLTNIIPESSLYVVVQYYVSGGNPTGGGSAVPTITDDAIPISNSYTFTQFVGDGGNLVTNIATVAGPRSNGHNLTLDVDLLNNNPSNTLLATIAILQLPNTFTDLQNAYISVEGSSPITLTPGAVNIFQPLVNIAVAASHSVGTPNVLDIEPKNTFSTGTSTFGTDILNTIVSLSYDNLNVTVTGTQPDTILAAENQYKMAFNPITTTAANLSVVYAGPLPPV